MTLKRRNLRWEEVDKSNILLDKLIRHYESFNRTEGKSPKTISWYSDTLHTFEGFLKRHDSALLRDAGINEVREFILYLQEKEKRGGNGRSCSKGSKLSPFTVQGFVRSLKAFYSWLHREGYTEINELARLKLPKTPKKLVETLSQEEIRQILGCLNPLTAVGTRDIAIFMTFIDTGLRCSELAELKLMDVNMEQGSMKVLGKGSRERIVPIGNGVQKVFQRYIFHFRPEPLDTEAEEMFLSLDGNPLTVNAMKLLFARLAKKSGVKRLHAHLCRHTFATNYLINGGDVFSLQQILGHSTLEMVRNYVNLASTQVTIQHRKFSPVDRMNLGRIRFTGTSHNANGKGFIEKKHLEQA
ncbi:tyrosine-type recombinase/integrase [Chloroflexota bacterium]